MTAIALLASLAAAFQPARPAEAPSSAGLSIKACNTVLRESENGLWWFWPATRTAGIYEIDAVIENRNEVGITLIIVGIDFSDRSVEIAAPLVDIEKYHQTQKILGETLTRDGIMPVVQVSPLVFVKGKSTGKFKLVAGNAGGWDGKRRVDRKPSYIYFYTASQEEIDRVISKPGERNLNGVNSFQVFAKKLQTLKNPPKDSPRWLSGKANFGDFGF